MSPNDDLDPVAEATWRSWLAELARVDAPHGFVDRAMARLGGVETFPPAPASSTFSSRVEVPMKRSLATLSLADVLWTYFAYVRFVGMLLGMWTFLFFFRGCSMDFIPQDNHQMAPTYTGGNMVIFSNPLIHNKATGLEKGDAVIYGDPAARGESADMMFLGRVIAFGGDRIKVEKGEVYVAGNKVTEAGYLSNANREDFTLDEMVVPAGHVYLLVDNRGLYASHRYKPYARDSRHFGPVSEAAIKAKITSKWKYSGGGG